LCAEVVAANEIAYVRGEDVHPCSHQCLEEPYPCVEAALKEVPYIEDDMDLDEAYVHASYEEVDRNSQGAFQLCLAFNLYHWLGLLSENEF
jgi:hypothetical protein